MVAKYYVCALLPRWFESSLPAFAPYYHSTRGITCHSLISKMILKGMSMAEDTQSLENNEKTVDSSLKHPQPPPRIPPQSWDSHMHIFEPHSLDHAGARYTPIASTLPLALDFESSLGLRNIVLVQPSCYGYDNTYLLRALRQLGTHRARGVVAFDPSSTPHDTLRMWHRIGVRGARVNLKSVDATLDRESFETTLRAYADLIRPLGWVLQLYIPMELIEWLEEFAAELKVKICLDHFGCPDLRPQSSRDQTTNPYTIPGFPSLINLLQQGHTWVKLSAPYRVSRSASYEDLGALATELIRVAGRTRLVFATDWPHTRFNGLDIRPFVARCVEWCAGDQELLRRLFRGNAEELWDVQQQTTTATVASL